MLSITIKPYDHPVCTKCRRPAEHVFFLRKSSDVVPRYSCTTCLHDALCDYIEAFERRGNA